MSKSALVIINPVAGQEEADHYEKEIKEILTTEYSKIDVKYTSEEGDATRFAKSGAEDAVDLVVALGGDGTVNEVVNGLAPLERPPLLGIIPMGTVNDLARSLNIPLDADDAIKLLIRGAKKAIDVGLVNDRYFTNFIIIGHAAKAIHEVESSEKSKLGSFAYFIEVAKKIAEDSTFQAKIEMDQENWEGELALLIIGLIDSLGGMKSILADVSRADGAFHLLLLKELNVSKVMNMTPAMLSGKISKSDNVDLFTSKEIKVSSLNQELVESDLDGEKGPELPIDLKIFPKHLNIITGLTSSTVK